MPAIFCVYGKVKIRYNVSMENLRTLLKEQMNIDFMSAVLSGPRTKDGTAKVKVRPLMKKDTLFFQLEIFRGNQAFHKNLEPEASMSHNRKKQYVLEEGTAVPFLTDLGVMTQEGKVVHARFDKFRQINRFLEFVEDILPELPKDREVTILDFGCGKSYLTFAMYYYLHELKGYDIRIIGLDLKKDVIRHCNELSEKYGYKKLHFLEGNIADYTGVDAVDMVVTLHACDTATDFALAKAVGWNAKVILSVPCCQHELNRQIKNDVLAPVFEYGLIKERMAALITDAIRAQYLEREGYRTQILEFIDMEHTPKNILIRAVKTGKRKDNQEAIESCENALHITPTLGQLLDELRGAE